jgi:opacity protein-like surface antigen
MKRLMIAAAVVAILSAPALAADVGVSVSIGQPGFYGRLDIGGYPQPQVIYSQPRIIQRGYEEREPVYMRVPPGHARNWRRYCGRYNACNERVYFVQDNWYNHEYAPRYREKHHNQRDERRNERYDERGNDHRGNDNNGNDHRGNEHGRDKH